MPVVGVGIDVVDIERFGESLERTPGLGDRLFTAAEARLRLASLAARFAAKEALAKALGVLGDRASLDGDAVTAAVARSETPAVIRALVEAGVQIEEARWIGADLEDVFMTETGWTGVRTKAAKGTPHAG